VARRVAGDLASDGAEAVVLVGSHAHGDAGPNSDLDLLAVGDESYLPKLEHREGMLVSVSMQPFAVHRESFGQPELVCTAVPGWRDAVILHDPEGLAASLVGEARAWTWEAVERRCDDWVAEEVPGFAEEIHKLISALEKGSWQVAAVQRSLLAVRLAPILAVHYRILYGSENLLWDLVSEVMGEKWYTAQSSALGLSSETFMETVSAALLMYAIVAAEVEPLMDVRQSEVVSRACQLAQSASL